MSIPREEREALQLKAVQIQFRRLRDRIPALQKLADHQGLNTIEEWLGRLEAFGMLVVKLGQIRRWKLQSAPSSFVQMRR